MKGNQDNAASPHKGVDMSKKKPATGQVWGVKGGKLHLFTGVSIGKVMITFPGGQRWAKDGRGTDGYYATELDAASNILPAARWNLEYHQNRMLSAESLVADCERVLGIAKPLDTPGAVGAESGAVMDAVHRDICVFDAAIAQPSGTNPPDLAGAKVFLYAEGELYAESDVDPEIRGEFHRIVVPAGYEIVPLSAGDAASREKSS